MKLLQSSTKPFVVKNPFQIVSILLLLITLSGCKKFLDEKSVVSYSTPQQISDLQALMDYYPALNTIDPPAGEISTGDYYLTNENWAALSSEYYRRLYTWERTNVFEPKNNDWQYGYAAINIANTVLDNINTVDPGNDIAQLNNVQGQALFFRAKNFLQLATLFCPAYDAADQGKNLGLPLRLNSNFNEASVRSSVEETYERVVKDLKNALLLLPTSQTSLLRPSKAAAYGMLARAQLFKRDYTQAGLYADSCLQLSNKLLDYNTLNPSATYPVKKFNAEVIFETFMPAPAPINPSRAKIDPALYASYQSNDLRKVIFFKNNNNGTFGFKGSYEGGIVLFTGLATDEMYLIRSESSARQGRVADALNDLNTLLKARWKGAYVPLAVTDKEELISLILQERRKELLMRGLYWADIKRLNKEGRAISLTRTVGAKTITLVPNDSRFVLPIPEDVIDLTGMPQNP